MYIYNRVFIPPFPSYVYIFICWDFLMYIAGVSFFRKYIPTVLIHALFFWLLVHTYVQPSIHPYICHGVHHCYTTTLYENFHKCIHVHVVVYEYPNSCKQTTGWNHGRCLIYSRSSSIEPSNQPRENDKENSIVE